MLRLSILKIEHLSYVMGFVTSLVLHLIGATVLVFVIEFNAAKTYQTPQIFTVTLEGGEHLGGVSQAPEKKEKKPKVDNSRDQRKVAKKQIKKVPKKATIIEKKKPKPKPKLKPKKKKVKKVKPKPKPKPKPKSEPKPKKKSKKKKSKAKKSSKDDLDKRLKQAVAKAKKRYKGESANAGGQGFGAARVGGKGMGGGTLASAEFIAYRNALERHIKSGWRWLPGARIFKAKVLVKISLDGTIQSARIVDGSGNYHFDDSVMRAVFKASPVPSPPERLYGQFREVRITFNSQEQ